MGLSCDHMTGFSLSSENMASAQQCMIEFEAFSCLKQAIVHFLWILSTEVDCQLLNSAAVGACETHFNWWGPVPNQSLRILIQQIATDMVTSH